MIKRTVVNKVYKSTFVKLILRQRVDKKSHCKIPHAVLAFNRPKLRDN